MIGSDDCGAAFEGAAPATPPAGAAAGDRLVPAAAPPGAWPAAGGTWEGAGPGAPADADAPSPCGGGAVCCRLVPPMGVGMGPWPPSTAPAGAPAGGATGWLG